MVRQRIFLEIWNDVEFVSREIGYERMSVYAWRRNYLKYEMLSLMEKRKNAARESLSKNYMLSQFEKMEGIKHRFKICSLK